MKFTLEIELGNDAMRSYANLRSALDDVKRMTRSNAAAHQLPTLEDGSKIMDENGNSVGSWKIEAD